MVEVRREDKELVLQAFRADYGGNLHEVHLAWFEGTLPKDCPKQWDRHAEQYAALRQECDALRDRADKALVRAEAAEQELGRLRKLIAATDPCEEQLRERDEAIARAEVAEERVRQLVNQRAVLLKERDAKHDAAVVQRWIEAANELRAKYEALLAKATPPKGLRESLELQRKWAVKGMLEALRWVDALSAATKPEPPKRKTREEIVRNILADFNDGAQADHVVDETVRDLLAALDQEAP